jgi:hypothetical protein
MIESTYKYDQSGSPLHCNPFRLNYSAKFGICTVVGLNGKLVEAKYTLGTLECAYFNFNKCTMKIHGDANAKFSL